VEKTVAVFAKNSREKVHVNLTEFCGRDLLDIRIYWSPDGVSWSPTKKGISIGIEKLPTLLASLHQAADCLGQDAPEPVGNDEELLTPEEKGIMCEELKVEMEQINGMLTD
jgi:hypothetical protein